jgi:protein arginine N-methyltransferase 1
LLNDFFCLAPGAGYTHWKQTVFYFPDYVTIKRDEVLEGTFACKVNLENPVSFFRHIFVHFERISSRKNWNLVLIFNLMVK